MSRRPRGQCISLLFVGALVLQSALPGAGAAAAQVSRQEAVAGDGVAAADRYAVDVARALLDSLIAGGIAYSLIYVMALTSTNAAQRRLGKWWRRIHKVGIHYVWLIFTASYAIRALGDDPQYCLEGRTLLPVMMAALGVRYLARRK